ncbi:MAG: hypothetical protein J7641_05595 [Cyanobacteria bacterium SID2]|nr:hypothetical protein [Cyanobacteria bacterium SID2]
MSGGCQVSGLSKHTQNLSVNPQSSILFLEDEDRTEEIFARRRLSFDCHVESIDRETEVWHQVVDRFHNRFGKIVNLLHSLADFQMFALKPIAGRFVVGFGAAYDVDTQDLDRLIPVKPQRS